MKRLISSLITLSLIFCLALQARAETLTPDHLPEGEGEKTETVYRAPYVDVIGQDESALEDIPGSGEIISAETLDYEQPISLQDAVRGLPGVHVRHENAAGLVPNIGIRGLNPDRSEKMLILEDGVSAGLAPYSENAAYFIPPIERMERVELLKGSGSILFGPQTVGGVLNMITPDVPKDYRARFRLLGGTDGYFMGIGRFGKTWGLFGMDVSLMHKRGDGFTRDESDFHATDVTAKFKFDISDKTKLILKGNFYDQRSSQSYLGLTAGLFDSDPRFNPAPHDRLDVEWYGLVLTLQHFFTDNIELLTNIYFWNAHRNWNRQDFARNNGFEAAPANTVATFGDTSIDGGALFMRESFGSRDRDFYGIGIEPRLIIDYDAFGHTHQMHTGVRFHFENMLNERNNRETLISDPVTRDRDRRKAYAFAFFFQNKLRVTKDLTLIPGFRLEHYTQDREFSRQKNEDVDFDASTTHTALIPGFGLTYQLPGNTTLFTGIHRGFAPPRTSQAISSDGEDLELDAEYSWNFEFGLRTNPWPWWKAEATFFFMDFENQVVPANESGGASTTNTNAGETRHIGFEIASSLDILGLAGFEKRHQLFLDTNYTFVDTENTTNNGLFEGNDLPYAPEHLARVGFRYQANEGIAKGLTVGIEGIYTGEQFADQANTRAESADGTVGIIDDYFIFNAYARYKVPKTRLELHLTGNNLFDNTYVVSRAPRGIFPGPGIQIIGGLKYDIF